VESEPSIKPTIAGCTRCSRKCCSPVITRVYQTVRKLIEHKAHLTNVVRST
jgi:hypothetical protein